MVFFKFYLYSKLIVNTFGFLTQIMISFWLKNIRMRSQSTCSKKLTKLTIFTNFDYDTAAELWWSLVRTSNERGIGRRHWQKKRK